RGTFAVAAGATLDFPGSNGGPTFTSTSSLSGPGDVRFNGDIHVNGTYAITGRTTIDSNASFNLDSADAHATTVIQSGRLGGTGNLVIPAGGSFTWTGGDQVNAGSTIVEAGATLTVSGSADKTLAGRTLVNHGTATWSGSGALRGSFSTTRLINSGVFEVQTDALLGSPFFAELTVDNQA